MRRGAALTLSMLLAACGASSPTPPASTTPLTLVTAAASPSAPAPSAPPSPTASPRSCDLTVGPAQVVIPRSKLVALGFKGLPDGIFGTVKDGDRVTFFSAHAAPGAHVRSTPPDAPKPSSIARLVGTLDDPVAFDARISVPITGVKAPLDYLGGGPIYRDAQSGMLLLFYHAERWPGLQGDQFWASYGLARSMDGGLSWVDLGEFYTPEAPFVDQVPPGTATFARTVPVPAAAYVIVNGYFYVYAKDRSSYDKPTSFLTVSRARVDEVVAAARSGTVSPWSKYFNGAWNEPGLAGKASPLETGNPQIRNSDVAYDPQRHKYVMVVIGAIPNDRDGVYLIESDDGLAWGPRKVIDEGPNPKLFPTIVGLGPDPRVVGSQFYLYYPRDKQNQPDTDILRRTITCG